MRFLTKRMERSLTQTNCNPIGYVLALAAIVAGVSYHFRDAILNVIKDCVEIMAAAFLIYAVIHITGHIVAHRRRLAHDHQPKLATAGPEEPAEGDPVKVAEQVVSQAWKGLDPEATQDRPGRVG